MNKLSLIAASFALALGLGCSPATNNADAGPDASARPTCTMLGALCHPFDMGSGPGHECHEFGHDPANNEAACVTKLAECMPICSGDGGHGHDEDASSDGH